MNCMRFALLVLFLLIGTVDAAPREEKPDDFEWTIRDDILKEVLADTIRQRDQRNERNACKDVMKNAVVDQRPICLEPKVYDGSVTVDEMKLDYHATNGVIEWSSDAMLQGDVAGSIDARARLAQFSKFLEATKAKCAQCAEIGLVLILGGVTCALIEEALTRNCANSCPCGMESYEIGFCGVGRAQATCKCFPCPQTPLPGAVLMDWGPLAGPPLWAPTLVTLGGAFAIGGPGWLDPP